MDSSQILALAWVLLQWDLADVSMVVLIMFDAILRTGEGMQLNAGDFSFQHGRCYLALHNTKGSARKGAPEGITLCSAPLSAWVESVARRCQPGEFLLKGSTAHFRSAWSAAVAELGLHGIFLPYSCRRGGATAHFLCQGSFLFITVAYHASQHVQHAGSTRVATWRRGGRK